ncbi:MAG TPA: hemolysin D, partial [Armatimonadota bacterium]|nr:hemolysin D [Armatimonadota bacterium]
MKRIAPIIIVIVLAVAAIIVFKTIASKKTDTPMLGSGIIEATEIRVSTKTPGRLAEMLVREGDVVERG